MECPSPWKLSYVIFYRWDKTPICNAIDIIMKLSLENGYWATNQANASTQCVSLHTS